MAEKSDRYKIDLDAAFRRFDEMLAIFDAAVRRRRPPNDAELMPAEPPGGPKTLAGGAVVDPDDPLT